MNKYLKILKKEKWATITIFGALAFSFILITTLSLTLAFVSLVIFSSLAVFQKSFHYGLVFFLGIILIFPPVYVVNDIITTEEVFVLILALIGLINLFLEKYKFKIFPLFYYWIGLISLSVIILILTSDASNIFNNINHIAIKQFIIIFIIYPIIIISFQHFFQTTRRLERFFLTVVFVGVVQSLISLIFFRGLLNIDQFLQVEDSALAMLLVITIPVTLGMWLIQKKSLSTLKFSWISEKEDNINQSVDSVLTNKYSSTNKPIINLKRARINKQTLFMGSLLLQVIALAMTFSFISLIAVGLGIFIVGILMRDKKIILPALSFLLGFIIILPGLDSVLIVQSKQEILDFVHSIKGTHGIKLLWQGITIQQYQQINSAYLFIFSKLGLVGLVIFGLGLMQYFREIRNAYLKSDKFQRVWLIIILVVFVEFVLLGVLNNVFFAWPAALLFWLLYGALQNLKCNKKEYRLTETVINKFNKQV